MICYLFPEPTYFIYSSDVPSLLYYAHIPAIIISLFVGFFVFWSGRKFLLNRLFFLISILFSFWATVNLITWTNIHSNIVMFAWSFFSLILGLLAILSIYFIYVFLNKEDISNKIKFIFITLLAPIFLFSTTSINISGFNITDCDAFRFEWLPFKIYYTLLGVLALVWIFVLLIRKYRISTSDFKKQIIYMGVGIELFLFVFFVMIFLASYLTQIGVLANSSLEMYGLLGIVIFMIFISILITRFRTFNIKLLATEALVWGLVILIGSQFFFIKTHINFILNGIGFIVSIVLGQFLIKAVKREVEQRERLEQLRLKLEDTNMKLSDANEKLKSLDKLKTEFLSLASHQLRSPLTAIKGYTSMLSEGSFGSITPEQKEAIDRVFQSAQNLSRVVEDLLDVSKIEQGGMRFEFTPVDLAKMAETVVKELNVTATAKGLALTFEKTFEGEIFVSADNVKIRQVLVNLIDNSLKYTKQGFIKVNLSRNGGNVTVSISDSGIGISEEGKTKLFEKFSRGAGQKVNAGGSGLGLYLVKQILDAHKGGIKVESPGVDMGSTFSFTLPEVPAPTK